MSFKNKKPPSEKSDNMKRLDESYHQLDQWQKQYQAILDSRSSAKKNYQKTKSSKVNPPKKRPSSQRNKLLQLKRISEVKGDDENDPPKRQSVVIVSTKPLKKQKIYIEVYDGPNHKAQDLCRVFDDLISHLGGTVMKRLTTQTNVIVWQYGSLKSLEKGKLLNCAIVNPCWIDKCAIDNTFTDPAQFPIIELNSKEYEEIVYREVEFQQSNYKQKKWFKSKKVIDDPKIVDIENKLGQEDLERRINENIDSIMCQFMDNLCNCVDQQQPYMEQVTEKLHFQSFPVSKLKSKKKEGALQLTLHKSIGNEQYQQLKSLMNIKQGSDDNKYSIAEGDLEKFSSDYFVMGKEQNHDLYSCYFLTQKNKIVSYQWLQDSLDDLEFKNPEDYLDNNEIDDFDLSQFKIVVYKTRQRQGHENKLEMARKSHLEQVIKHFKGQVVNRLKDADICITPKSLKYQSLKFIRSEKESITIVKHQWLIESINSRKCKPFDEYSYC